MKIKKDEILKLCDKLYPKQVRFRRHLHRFPELSFEEFETTKYIREQLRQNRIKIKQLKMKTGLLAVVNEHEKPVIAIRTDIDALPVTEKSGLPFRSKNIGCMHACGHDIHMAVALGTALLLNSIKDKLPGGVKFLFQPAEEKPPGGAEKMILEGVLKNPAVKMILGLHVDPTVPVSKITLRDGPTMASVIDFDITIIGQGGHAALPHRAIDAVAVAAELVGSMQKIVSRETNPLKPAVITFGAINGGTVRNVIADKVVLNGTAQSCRRQSAGSQSIHRVFRRSENWPDIADNGWGRFCLLSEKSSRRIFPSGYQKQ
jgi:amidohydrolase